MKNVTTMLLSFLLVLCMGLIFSVDAISVAATGNEITITYGEPTTNEQCDVCAEPAIVNQADCTNAGGNWNPNAAPLTDLATTTIWYDNITTGTVKVMDVPASAPTGGGAVTKTFTVPDAQKGWERNYTFWVTAKDITGNTSCDSPKVEVKIDKRPSRGPK
jgi:hypothetical protein